eukprot:TRINITY_DN5112_c0_g1_i1.p1 TRINITY_DN5112_c0_g1~~TRINITY_DN5112_c0_g1_i1.p1  ORF type:complete len:875 (-),score=170.76 TRINITY_DN5112_c0_g1_i1:15-2639(-)
MDRGYDNETNMSTYGDLDVLYSFKSSIENGTSIKFSYHKTNDLLGFLKYFLRENLPLLKINTFSNVTENDNTKTIQKLIRKYSKSIRDTLDIVFKCLHYIYDNWEVELEEIAYIFAPLLFDQSFLISSLQTKVNVTKMIISGYKNLFAKYSILFDEKDDSDIIQTEDLFKSPFQSGGNDELILDLNFLDTDNEDLLLVSPFQRDSIILPNFVTTAPESDSESNIDSTTENAVSEEDNVTSEVSYESDQQLKNTLSDPDLIIDRSLAKEFSTDKSFDSETTSSSESDSESDKDSDFILDLNTFPSEFRDSFQIIFEELEQGSEEYPSHSKSRSSVDPDLYQENLPTERITAISKNSNVSKDPNMTEEQVDQFIEDLFSEIEAETEILAKLKDLAPKTDKQTSDIDISVTEQNDSTESQSIRDDMSEQESTQDTVNEGSEEKKNMDLPVLEPRVVSPVQSILDIEAIYSEMSSYGDCSRIVIATFPFYEAVYNLSECLLNMTVVDQEITEKLMSCIQSVVTKIRETENVSAKFEEVIPEAFYQRISQCLANSKSQLMKLIMWAKQITSGEESKHIPELNFDFVYHVSQFYFESTRISMMDNITHKVFESLELIKRMHGIISMETDRQQLILLTNYLQYSLLIIKSVLNSRQAIIPSTSDLHNMISTLNIKNSNLFTSLYTEVKNFIVQPSQIFTENIKLYCQQLLQMCGAILNIRAEIERTLSDTVNCQINITIGEKMIESIVSERISNPGFENLIQNLTNIKGCLADFKDNYNCVPEDRETFFQLCRELRDSFQSILEEISNIEQKLNQESREKIPLKKYCKLLQSALANFYISSSMSGLGMSITGYNTMDWTIRLIDLLNETTQVFSLLQNLLK